MKIFFIALLALSCAQPSLAENRFRYRLVADPRTFDWNQANTPMETPILMNIMEGLLEFDSKLKLKPQLAASWTVSEDQKTYTFKLKHDTVWSDGKPLIADHFIYSWRRLLDPLVASPYAYLLFDIDGAEDFFNRRTADFSKVGVKALDPFTLEVRLKKPVAYFAQMFTFWVTFPMRKDTVEKHGVAWTKPGNIAVVGPFVPTSYTPQDTLVLKRNERYHGKKPMADEIIFKIINEDTTALDLFKAGQLDFTVPLNFLELGSFTASPAFHRAPYLKTCFLNFNVTKYPFNLPKVRQAIAQSIDKSQLGKALHGAVEATDTFLPKSLFPEGAEIGFKFTQGSGRNTLKEVGVDPATFPPLEILATASDESALVTQYIQDQLKKNLGLKLSIQLPEFKMFRTQLDLKTGALYFWCWAADYADPDTFFDVFRSTSGNNHSGWKNFQYDDLVTRAGSIEDGPERVKLYREALEILLKKEAVIAPLYEESLSYLLNPKMKNFVINPLNYVFFRDIVFEK